MYYFYIHTVCLFVNKKIMTQKIERKSNAARTQAMREKLLHVARTLFIEKGYMETSTPDIVKAAEVTRGALYHHFEDKLDLFREVVEQESKAVADEIMKASSDPQSFREGLLDGARAYLSAMKSPERCKLLLIDGPAVLGREKIDEIDKKYTGQTLLEGIEEAIRSKELTSTHSAELVAAVLSSAFDRMAILVSQGESVENCISLFDALLSGIN